MFEVFELDRDEGIISLFEERKIWVPTYMRDTFCAEMSITQRSTLKKFVDKYKVALQDREEAKAHAYFKTLHKKPTLKSP